MRSDGPMTSLPDGPVVVYPLVSDEGNRRVLGDWLADHDSYTAVEADVPVAEAEFDLCIVDEAGLQRHAAKLDEVKSDAQPALLPVLLVLSEHTPDIIETDRGEIADSVLVSTVDEIVSLPMQQAELEWRIQALLRLRNQSLTLQSKTDELRRFREAVDASGHAIFITDPDGVFEYVNPAFEEITGYGRAEVLGGTPRQLKSGEMSDAYYEDLWNTITSGDRWEAEIVDQKKDGTYYSAYQTVAPIPDGEGGVSAFVAVQTDVTARKELRKGLKRHREVVQRLEDPIMLQDEDGTFRLVNEALADFAGLSKEELLGETEHRFMNEEAATRIERKKAEVMEAEQPITYTISPDFERSDRNATFSTNRYPYYDGDGELTGTFAICRDVTDLEERTRQLHVIDNILRHNLRNDLTIIRGLADQIRGRTSGDVADTAETILTHTDDLMSTGEKSRSITDLLSEDPTPGSIDVTSVIRSVVDGLTAVRANVRLDANMPERAVASTTLKIREAIEELVRNAVIHSDRDVPSIEIRVETTDEAVTVSVIDDGPGIPEMDRAVLETGQAIDDMYHGSGLGLWLVYWIVSRSGGSIAVSDPEPQGTDVTISLPRGTYAEE